jgi:hypothetical protein
VTTWRMFILGGGAYVLHRAGAAEGRIFSTAGGLHAALDIAESLARGSDELVTATGWRIAGEAYEKEF